MSRSSSRTIAERSPKAPTRARPGALTTALVTGLLVALAASSAALAAPLPWRAPFSEGEPVVFQGVVSGPAGEPLAGLDVALAASAPGIDWHELRRTVESTESERVQTDARGRFELTWSWDSAYRRFDLVVTVRVRKAGVDVDRELARLDVTDRVRQGSPVVAALTVERADFVRGLRAFLDSLVTDDQKRVHRQLGMPESIDQIATAVGTESAWWYFELGRVARFLDGRLTGVEEFEPVRPDPGESP